MLTRPTPPGSRLRSFRDRWNLSPDQLATRASVGADTIRGIEAEIVEADDATAERLAAALCVEPRWLLTGRDGMLPLACMTPAEQHRAQSGPGTDGLPG